jgi:hypothetical protein
MFLDYFAKIPDLKYSAIQEMIGSEVTAASSYVGALALARLRN